MAGGIIANICDSCVRDLPRSRDRCDKCALSIPFPGRCRRCRRAPPAIDRVVAAFGYTFPLDVAIRAAKFNSDFAACNALGELLAAHMAEDLAEDVDGLVPVPLHWRRARERGFNQSARIAGIVGSVLAIPVYRKGLKRTRATCTQSTLESAHARAQNVRGAFAVGDLHNEMTNLVIVDDVMTTGATIMECAAAIKAACPLATVSAWLVARVEV